MSNRPNPNFLAGISGFDRNAWLKKTATQVTRRDGSVVEEELTADGSYHRAEVRGEVKDMSYLERASFPPPSKSSNIGVTSQSPEWKIRSSTDLSLDPDVVWREIQETQVFRDVPTISARDSQWNTANSDCTRVVCISDTHGRHREISVPKGDILIHGGDITNTGETKQVSDIAKYFQLLAFPTTVCIAGNHDMTLDLPYYERSWRRFHRKKLNAEEGRQALVRLMESTTNATTSDRDAKFYYLEDSSCTVLIDDRNNKNRVELAGQTKQQAGTDSPGSTRLRFNPSVTVHKPQMHISIYGSPWSPEFCDWAFNVPRGAPSSNIWSKIPTDTDILVTHGPPLGRSDLCVHGGRAGCFDLLEHVQKRVQPRLHVFGHIHEAFGATYDGTTLFVNASNLDLAYASAHPCTVVDLPHDPRLPPRIVQPHCSVTGDDLVSGWFRDNGFQILADVVMETGCCGQDFPSGDALLNSADAHDKISSRLLFRTTKCLKAKGELRRALSQLYAESF